MKPVGLVLTFVSVTTSMVFFRAPTMASAVNIVKGIFGLNGVGLPQDILDRLGPLRAVLHNVGVIAEPWYSDDFVKAAVWIFFLLLVALACPNTLQILGRYEPALGIKSQPTNSFIGRFKFVEWGPSVPWAIAVSAIAAIAILSIGGPSEFLYWQF